MNESLTELRKKPHTSISAVREFLQCPRKYFLHYEAKVQPAFRPAALAFGSAWHATIGRWLLSTDETPESLRDDLRDGIVERLNDGDANVLFDDAEENEGTLVDCSLRMLDVFLAKVPRPEATIAVEQPFALEVSDADTGEVLPVPLVGSIDAIVRQSNRRFVWELKTAKRKWTTEQVEHDLQTTLYGLAAKNAEPGDAGLELVITTKSSKPDVQREVAVRHREHEKELVDVVFGVHRAVNAGVDHPIRSWACATCPWSGPCRP